MKNFKQRCKDWVNDPVFDKPIQNKDYTKKGVLTLVTKMSKHGIYRLH
jgi:hypothetical protein